MKIYISEEEREVLLRALKEFNPSGPITYDGQYSAKLRMMRVAGELYDRLRVTT